MRKDTRTGIENSHIGLPCRFWLFANIISLPAAALSSHAVGFCLTSGQLQLEEFSGSGTIERLRVCSFLICFVALSLLSH